MKTLLLYAQPLSAVSSSVPLVTLRSVRVGDAEVENVETVIYPMVLVVMDF